MRSRSRVRRSAGSFSTPIDSLVGRLLVPVLVVLGIALGGSSSGGYLANALVQLIATLILGFGIYRLRNVPLSRSSKFLVAIAVCWIGWTCLQLVPVPPSLWTMAPGREILQQRLAANGSLLPWLPLSMDPPGTISHLASLVPPLAMGALALSSSEAEANSLRWIIPLMALASLLLGVAQLISGSTSPLYFYKTSNQGLPLGFMANANHQATLMLCAIPFVASLTGTETAKGSKGGGQELLFVALAAMFVMGIVVSQSYAAFILALPVTIASWAIARPRSLGPARYIGTGVAVITAVALVVVILAGPTIVTDAAFAQPQLSRPAMYKVAGAALLHFFPWGSGAGTFVPVFKLFEDPLLVTSVFVNHAHCDYLELAMEAGIPGILLVLGLLLWWLRRAISIWFGRSASRTERAAVVATGAILAHSMVDYPARTTAIAIILSAGIALMAPRTEIKAAVSTGGRHLRAD